ncbi:MAG TPA: type II restriction endonuclease [Candidatus Nanoarchaeia archaeon]|nr:type II restriction endonuclease [Candidatus Nanoarchaeia archaeon]
MKKQEAIKLGSQTAKKGFKNERDIAKKFNNWKNDEDAKKWLSIMKYDLNKIEKVVAIVLSNQYKSDIQVKVSIYLKEAISAENISIKLVSNPKGYNQVDKRWVDKYAEMWSMPKQVKKLLKHFTGEIKPYKTNIRDKRRMFLDEFTDEEQQKIQSFFMKNKLLIVGDILKGRGRLSAEWMMVALRIDREVTWTLKPINLVLNIFGNGKVEITKKGSLKIGKITMQRKGGDAGRKTAQMLQFKINPVELFDSNG